MSEEFAKIWLDEQAARVGQQDLRCRRKDLLPNMLADVDYEVFEIQALMTSSPQFPRWSSVARNALMGGESWEDYHMMFHVDRFVDGWVFATRAFAEHILNRLLGEKQPYKLRLIRRRLTTQESFVAGYMGSKK